MDLKAVITGDIVSSSQIIPAQRGQLLDSLNMMRDELQTISPFRMELFRGDSFQLLIDQPASAVEIAILLRAGLKFHTPDHSGLIWDARTSIGIGKTEFVSDNVVTSDGQAFQISGRLLDGMSRNRLACRTPWQDVDDELKLTMALADDIITGWTTKQAGMIYFSFGKKLTKKDIASAIGTSVQNVRVVLASAKENLIKLFIERNKAIISAHLHSDK